MKCSIALFSTLFGSASAFSSPASVFGVSRSTSQTALAYAPQHFERAVECATSVGECDLNELESLANELEMDGIRMNGDDSSTEVMKVKEILRAQHKFMAMNEEYQKEFKEARAAKEQLVSWPSEEDVSSSVEEAMAEHPKMSTEVGQKTPILPMQVVYEDGKDFGVDIHDEYGPYARQLNYQGHDYFD